MMPRIITACSFLLSVRRIGQSGWYTPHDALQSRSCVMTRAQTWNIKAVQHPERSLTAAAVDQRGTCQRLLGHLHVGGIDEHTVDSHRASTPCLGLSVGGDIGFGAGDLVGGWRVDLVGDRNLVGVNRPRAGVA